MQHGDTHRAVEHTMSHSGQLAITRAIKDIITAQEESNVS